MAQSNQRNQQLAELAARVVADDPAIKAQMSKLVSDIIAYQSLTMRVGSPQEKSALVKAVLPQMLGAMNTVAQDEAAAEERASIERMYAMMRGEQVPHSGPMDKIGQMRAV